MAVKTQDKTDRIKMDDYFEKGKFVYETPIGTLRRGSTFGMSTTTWYFVPKDQKPGAPNDGWMKSFKKFEQGVAWAWNELKERSLV